MFTAVIAWINNYIQSNISYYFYLCMQWSMINYRKISYIRRTKSQNLTNSCLVLQLSLSNPLKTGVKSRMQAMLQLHLSDQQFNCLLRWVSVKTKLESYGKTARYLMLSYFRKEHGAGRPTSIVIQKSTQLTWRISEFCVLLQRRLWIDTWKSDPNCIFFGPSEFDGWPRKQLGTHSVHRSYVRHFIVIHEFTLELSSGNIQIRTKSSTFRFASSWNLEDDL